MNEMNQRRIMKLRSMPYEDYLQTPEWKERRDQALERDDYRCRACNSDENLHVHHRTYARRGNEDLNDLTTLCKSCHEHFHAQIWHSQEAMMVKTYSQPSLESVEDRRERRRAQWEKHLIGLLSRYPDLLPHVRVLLVEDDFTSKDMWIIYRCLSDGQSIPTSLEALMARITAETADIETQKWAVSFAKQAVEAVVRMKRSRLMQQKSALHEHLVAAEKAGDRETMRQLRAQLYESGKQLRTLESAMHL